ncbi:MAG: ammonium transporter, partial [Candidatus Hydrogenedentes bacterium]|nr:ammonium transporter [Candidatus Hydrogenedentota bacterium]
MERMDEVQWMLVTGGLVFLMQAGFMCLESGLTRSKNSINVAIKNLTDFVITFLIFWLLGFGIMFGTSERGFTGVDHFVLAFEHITPWLCAFFFFQAMFAATSATILSGAIAERIHFGAYCTMCAVTSGLVYPVTGHWIWNAAAEIGGGGWLQNMGFVDFAGSTVVHSVGGWISLAAVLILGPRVGRFVPGESPRKITGHNVPLSVLGALLLFMGWFGFNGGSTLALNEQVPMIFVNTALGACAGALAMLLLGWSIGGRPDVEYVINGTLAGLVAITANCHAVGAAHAALIGAVGGVVCLVSGWLLEALRVDDAVGAIPVHLAAGIWGTLATGLFGNLELLGTGLNRSGQIFVQCEGILAAGLWAFGVSYLIFSAINRIRPLRITADQEQRGLNIAEHGASTELIDLLTAMDRQGRAGDLSMRVPVEPFTEVGQIARRYNQVMDLLQRAVSRAEAIVRDLQDGVLTFARDGLVLSLNPGAEKLFGVRAEDLVGQPVTLLFAGAAGGVLDMPRLLRAQDGRGPLPASARHGERGEFPVEVNLSRTETIEGPMYTALVRDITRRKAAEDALEASRALILTQNRAMAHLAALEAARRGDLDNVLEEIVRVSADTLKLGRVSVWRAREDREGLSLVSLGGPAASGPERIQDLDFESLPGFAAALDTGRLIVVRDTWSDARTQDLWGAYCGPYTVGALLAANVLVGGARWGTLFFEHTDGPRSWAPETQQFAGSIADYVALAVEDQQRRLAEETVREINRELEARVAARTADLERSNQELTEAMQVLRQTQAHLVQSEKMAALGSLVAGVAHEINTPIGVALTAASHLQKKTRELTGALQDGGLKRSML